MNKRNRQEISELKKLPSILQKQILERLPSKNLFNLLDLDRKNFVVIAKIILNKTEKEDEEAPFYQIKLLKLLSQIKNTELARHVLKTDVSSYPLIEKISEFAKEAEGQAVMSAWVLLAQYANKTLVMDDALIQSFTKIGMLHVFSPFLTPEQCNTHLLQRARFPAVVEKKESVAVAPDDIKVDAKLNEIKKGLAEEKDVSKYEEAVKQLKIFIHEADPAIFAHHINKILTILGGNFDTNQGKTIVDLFGIFIKKTPDVAFTKSEEIFDIIKKYLCLFSTGPKQFSLWNSLKIFINRMPDNISSDKEEAIQWLIQKGLIDNQRGALQAFFDFIKKTHTTYFKIDEIHKRLKEGLSHSESDIQSDALSLFLALIKRGSEVSFEMGKAFGPPFRKKEEQGIETNIWDAPVNEEQSASKKMDEIGSLIIQKLDENNASSVKKAALDVLVACIKKKVPLEQDLWIKLFTCIWHLATSYQEILVKQPAEFIRKDIQKSKLDVLSLLTTLIKHCPSSVLIENKAPKTGIAEVQKVLCFLRSLLPSTLIEKSVNKASVPMAQSVRPSLRKILIRKRSAIERFNGTAFLFRNLGARGFLKFKRQKLS